MIRAALAVAAVLIATPLAAGEIVEDTPSLTARVDDAAAFAATPDLQALLREENEDLLAQVRAQAAEDTEAMKSAGQPVRPYDLQVGLDPRYASGRYVSLLRTISIYTGGAHPNHHLEPMTWDVAAKDFVRLDAFLAPGSDTRHALVAISRMLREALKAREGTWPAEIDAATVPDPTVLQNFTLERSTQSGLIGGLAFHFEPYEVAPYAMGPQEVVIPQAAISGYLTPEAAPLFGGAPAR
jgi:hypothetical protein